MNFLKTNYKGILLTFIIALPAMILGKLFPIIGGPVFAILIGIFISRIVSKHPNFAPGIRFTSKKILQYAVILLGFGLNLEVVIQTGKQSLPIIISTIATSLVLAYICSKAFKMDTNIATLIGVGSSICGGSAIAATAPVIDADDEEVAQAISVIFLFNILAALIFPTLGAFIGFSTTSGDAFGIFAGTAVNDTSSVTATASTWDSLYNLGSETLDKAVTVKLTRTLAIIPITLSLALYRSRMLKKQNGNGKVSAKGVFPTFILYFVIASIITTVLSNLGVQQSFFKPFKEASKFLIIMAMSAIGINTDVVKLIKTGAKPILLGFICWIGITTVAIMMQFSMGLI